MMSATFGPGAGSLDQELNRQTKLQTKIEILQANESRLQKRLQHIQDLYKNAEESLILSEKQVHRLEGENETLSIKNYE